MDSQERSASMIGKRHRVYDCGLHYGCKCGDRVFREGDLVVFLYTTDGLGQGHDRGDLGILISKNYEEYIENEKTCNKWRLIHWTVFHQKSCKYQDDIVEGEFDFPDDLGVHHD